MDSAGLSAQDGEVWEMIYRDIGKTGKQAGIIGLGCEHLDGAPYSQVESVVRTALDGGVDFLDCFMPGRAVRENIAKALGSRRKDVSIQGHIGSTDVKEQYDVSRDLPTVKRYFEDMLRIFGWIDFGMLFFVDSEESLKKVFDGGIADYAQKLKQNGDVRHIGFSSHNPVVATKIVESGLVEMMMFSINPAFDLCPPDADVLDMTMQNRLAGEIGIYDPVRVSLYQLCEHEGIGISVMKTLCGGKLVSPEHTPFSMPMSTSQCIHYALSRPAVFSVLIGCKKPQEVEAALSYLSAEDAQKDYTPFLGEFQNGFKGNCVYCNHCLPCPVGIDIAAVNKYLDLAKLDMQNIPPSIRSHYNGLPCGGKDCIECGSCESRCPFGVPVIENMRQAADVF
jgi:predicted aldo/keto reductase-like oxidoreductase